MTKSISAAIDEVLRLQNFSPSPQVNETMTNLVASIVTDQTTDVGLLQPAVKSSVRTISANAETEMEKFWAGLISQSANPTEALENFPYINNYVELIRRELELVANTGTRLDANDAALVIGSGPLPLSALEIHRQTGAWVDHVDSSGEAIGLSTAFLSALNVESEHYHAMGHEVRLNKQYDLILIAALAGSTLKEKQDIVNNILPNLAPNGRIIVRSAAGNRELLYPSIEPLGLTGIELLKQYHPTDFVINSVLVYKKL